MASPNRQFQIKLGEALGRNIDTSADIPSQARILTDIKDLTTEVKEHDRFFTRLCQMIGVQSGSTFGEVLESLGKIIEHLSVVRTRAWWIDLCSAYSLDPKEVSGEQLSRTAIYKCAEAATHLDLIKGLQGLFELGQPDLGQIHASVEELVRFKEDVRTLLDRTAHRWPAQLLDMLRDLKKKAAAFEQIEVELNQGSLLTIEEAVAIVRQWRARLEKQEGVQQPEYTPKPYASPFDRRAIWRQYFISKLSLGVRRELAANEAHALVEFEITHWGGKLARRNENT